MRLELAEHLDVHFPLTVPRRWFVLALPEAPRDSLRYYQGLFAEVHD